MAAYINSEFSHFLQNSSATFPAGAKAYKATFKEAADTYEVWSDKGIPFDSLLTAYPKSSGNFLDWNGIAFQFGADHTVDVFVDNSANTTPRWTGTWEEKTVQNQILLVIDIPQVAILSTDNEGLPIFVKWSDGNAWEGQYLAAGSIYTNNDFDFNKTAFDAVMGNLSLAGSSNGGGAASPSQPSIAVSSLVGTWTDNNDPTLGTGYWHIYRDGTYTMEFPATPTRQRAPRSTRRSSSRGRFPSRGTP